MKNIPERLKTLLAFFRDPVVILSELSFIRKIELEFFRFRFPVPGREMFPRYREKDFCSAESFTRKITGLTAREAYGQQQPDRTAFFNTAIFLQVLT